MSTEDKPANMCMEEKLIFAAVFAQTYCSEQYRNDPDAGVQEGMLEAEHAIKELRKFISTSATYIRYSYPLASEMFSDRLSLEVGK